MKRDLTDGSVTKNIIHLAWPMAVAFLLQVSLNIVDTVFIGWYSDLALTAISITFPVIFLIIALASGVGIGVTSYIARLIGSKRIDEAKKAAKHSLVLSCLLGIIFTVCGLVFSKPLFVFLGAKDEVLSMALQYNYTMFIGSVFMLLAFTGSNILRGEGDVKTPMKRMILANVINIILDPLFIFGIWIFPRMGIFGAALATVIAQLVSATFILWYLFRGNALLKLDLKWFKFDWGIIKEIFRVGVPASLSQSVVSLGMFFMLKIVSYFGPYAIAAYGIVSRLDSVAILPAIGIAGAAIVIVGHNVGARKFDRAESTTWKAVLLASAFMELVGLIFFLAPEFWVNIFNKNPDIVRFGASYLRIVSLTYMFTGIVMIIAGAFQGAGKGVPSLVLTSLRLFFLGIPLACLFAFVFDYGVTGIWIGVMLSAVLTGITSVIWFKLGTWKKGKHMQPIEPTPEVI